MQEKITISDVSTPVPTETKTIVVNTEAKPAEPKVISLHTENTVVNGGGNVILKRGESS